MVVRVHKYLKGLKANGALQTRVPLPKQAAEATGDGESTVGATVRDSNANGGAADNYLDRKRANLTAEGLPILPEIYLDESYCNLNHVAGRTWTTTGAAVNRRSGRGARYVIVGAGYVRTANGELEADWVTDSFTHWETAKKGVGADYNGNFNAEVFEKWFTKLCINLRDRFGPCRIHMDGASYHKRRTNPVPTGKSMKAHIIEWLIAQCIPYQTGMKKSQLLEIVHLYKPSPVYASVVIAGEHGHEILFTPPYHPDLQPIELVWGAIKNRITIRPETNMKAHGERILAEKAAIETKVWLGAYIKVQAAEVVYHEMDDEVLASDDESSESDSDDVTEWVV
ncbi:hypothetical protein ATCC90586_005340 [Pythium insidiosum]|nr:hypothetical protein ATCC90586_005340 [Pythium insidiosum]